MRILKSPMFYIMGLVILMIGAGYYLKQQTEAEQERNQLNEKVVKFPNYPYNLYGACHIDPSTYFVVGSNGIILHSKDGGRLWTECSLDLPGKNLISVCFIDEYTGWAVGSSGLAYETVDGGLQWTQVKLRAGDTCLKRVYFQNKKVGWIVGEGPTIFYSGDTGKNWEERGVDKELVILNDIQFFNSNEGLIVGEYGTVFYTEDGGSSWQEIPTFTEQAIMRICVVNESEAWICGLKGVLFHSSDKGKTWREVNVSYGDTQLKDHLFDCAWIPAAGTGNDVIYVIGDGVMARSFDLGRAWRHTLDIKYDDTPVRYQWFYDIVFTGNAGGIAVGKNGYIAFSDDAERWERVH